MERITSTLLVLMSFILLAASQSSSCSTTLTPSNSVVPSIASGYRAQLIATGLASPRSIEFDAAGNLLVVEQTNGGGSVSALTFKDDGGTCLSLVKKSTIVTKALNHGLALSADGKTLYASSSESAWSWSYNSEDFTVSNEKTLVMNMTNSDHTTRTLLLSKKVPGYLLISRGSTTNIDEEAASISSGHSQVKAFNLNNMTNEVYDFSVAGLRLGWGLRNSVGVAEHPDTGGIFTVENSADEITRDGQDVHEDNPGEEMNFHGYLNGTEYAHQGQDYGYPFCFATWNVSDLPQNSNLSVGSQFAIDGPDLPNPETDAYCAGLVAPRLTFQAHMAPLDIKFNNSGKEAWITFHGSWDRTEPIGYKLSYVEFANGEPVAASTSNTALIDIFKNMNDSICPDHCFRPVGIAIDSAGRIFISSDATGEIYVIMKEETASSSQPSSSATSPVPVPTHSGAFKLQEYGTVGLLAFMLWIMVFSASV